LVGRQELLADWIRERPGYNSAAGAKFESEPTFLARHGLLADDERHRLKAAAFEPVPLVVDELEAV
jgi:hypothetical protein